MQEEESSLEVHLLLEGEAGVKHGAGGRVAGPSQRNQVVNSETTSLAGDSGELEDRGI